MLQVASSPVFSSKPQSGKMKSTSSTEGGQRAPSVCADCSIADTPAPEGICPATWAAMQQTAKALDVRGVRCLLLLQYVRP